MALSDNRDLEIGVPSEFLASTRVDIGIEVEEEGAFGAMVAVDADALGEALRWEPSRNDDLFPHLYGELDLGAVTGVLDLRARSDGNHDVPELKP